MNIVVVGWLDRCRTFVRNPQIVSPKLLYCRSGLIYIEQLVNRVGLKLITIDGHVFDRRNCMHAHLIAVTTSASLLTISGCASRSTPPSYAEPTETLYSEFRDAARAKDVGKVEDLFCPQYRATAGNPNGWMALRAKLFVPEPLKRIVQCLRLHYDPNGLGERPDRLSGPRPNQGARATARSRSRLELRSSRSEGRRRLDGGSVAKYEFGKCPESRRTRSGTTPYRR